MDYINSLISGIVIFKIGKEYIYVKPATAEDKAFADFFSKEEYDEALIDGMWTQKDAEEYLIEIGHWSLEEEDKIKDIDKNIENMKLDYFNHFYNSSTKDYIKKNINKQEERKAELISRKYHFFDKTCEFLQQYSFNSYLLQNYAFTSDGDLASIFFSTQTLYNKHNKANNNLAKDLRKIAKSIEWKHRWFALKTGIFKNDPSSFTDLQLSLISWSTYYDNVYQSYEKPSDDIIDDDIALDGWSISERRKRKEEEKKKNAEKMLPENMKNAGEIFIPTRNQKEAEDVMSLNSYAAKAKIKSLRTDLSQSGSVDASNLTSTRREIQMQANKLSKKGR